MTREPPPKLVSAPASGRSLKSLTEQAGFVVERKRRVVDIAVVVTEGVAAAALRERGSGGEPVRQVRVGDEVGAEGEQVGGAVLDEVQLARACRRGAVSVAGTTLAGVPADELREMLLPFRTRAVEEGYPWEDVDPLPAEEVDRWIRHARPCAVLTSGADGPVAGAFGGPLLLPAEVPDPEYPYLASVDFAALPKDATDLPLPPDGRLLLFASLDEPDGEGNYGQAIYVPAGTPVEERDKNTWKGHDYSGDDHYQQIVDSYPQGALRARTEPDLPYYELPGFPHAEELVTVWRDASDRSGHLQVGGYADQEDSDPDPLARLASSAVREARLGRWGDGEPVSGAVEDWVLLAHWNPDISDREGADVQWGIQRADLEARRFDRTFSSVYWNP